MLNNKAEYFKWIDFLKGLAIIAVVLDHMCGILYIDYRIQLMSFYSVTLFIILAGITSYISMDKKRIINYDFGYVLKRLKSVLVKYIIATIIITTYSMRFFDLKVVLDKIINFTASGPFYFIVFFCQLIVVSPILYLFLKKVETMKKMYSKLFFLILILFMLTELGLIFTKYTLVLPLHGGGRYILGGSFLPIFFIGMIFASFNLKIKTVKTNVIFTSVGFMLLFIFFVKMCNPNSYVNKLNRIFSIWDKNPTGTVIFVYSFLVFITFWSLYILSERLVGNKFMKLFKPVEKCGEYSMDIFLYHLLAYTIATDGTIFKIEIIRNNIYLFKVYVLLFTIGIPILSKIVYKEIMIVIKKHLYIN